MRAACALHAHCPPAPPPPPPPHPLWPKVKHVACGARFSLVLTASGDAISWGHGSNGQLGHGECSSEAAPRVVKALLGKRARLPACGAAHSAVLCASGDVYLFGRNGDGAAGLGSGLQPRLPI